MSTSVGPDGIDVSGYGWTNQSSSFNSNKSLQSYGPVSSSLFAGSLRQGYSAWTYDPNISTAAGISANATTLAALIYVPENFTCSNIDWIGVSGTPNVTLALWPATAPAGTATPLVWSAATAQVATSVNTTTWAGSSSPTSVGLIGGQSYFVTLYGSTTGVVGCLSSASYTTNAAVSGTYSITTTYRAGSVGTLAGSVTAASVFGTSALTANMIWIGLH